MCVLYTQYSTNFGMFLFDVVEVKEREREREIGGETERRKERMIMHKAPSEGMKMEV